MIVLQVHLLDMNPGQIGALTRRFGRFFSQAEAAVEYPVTCNSHGYDVFEDDFGVGTVHEDRLYAAWLVELPYDADDFVPFSEETAGVALAEWTPGNGWDDHVASD